MKVLVVEDETAATVNLLALLNEVCPSCRIMGTLESVSETVAWLESNPVPDLIFTDIHLADGDAFRIFEHTEVTAPVVFTTAYDRYALEAFGVNSIDYLLKPIKTQDLERAIDKFSRLTGTARHDYTDRVNGLRDNKINRSRTFLVHLRDKLIPVKTEEVAYFHTADEKVTLCTNKGESYPFDKSLDTVMGELPQNGFFRANRQFIVSRGAIRDISVWFGSRLNLNLTVPVPERIIVSKARVPVFKRWLGNENDG
ncbi:MAG: LytTR family DNA-binding domain-containing protein [Rikenellaceae bacterium]|nr:LytTR family DNA-binding domain-containing protein [Rikenellaceae bacterium]